MPEERNVKKMFKNTTERKRSVGKPRKRWLDDDGNCLKKMGARGWRKVGNHRDAWKLILKEARVPAWTVEPLKDRYRERAQAPDILKSDTKRFKLCTCRQYLSKPSGIHLSTLARFRHLRS